MRSALRVALLAAALFDTGCRDDDPAGTTDGPLPATFTGVASDGSRVRVDVARIEAFSFVCDGDLIRVTLDPRGRLHVGEDVTVRFTVGGRTLRLRRTFLGDDEVAGAIADERHRCDLQYHARRAMAAASRRDVTTMGMPLAARTSSPPTMRNASVR